MRPMREAWCVQIEVTNVCPHTCAYCSRYVRHLRPEQRFTLSPEALDQALLSVQDFPGMIGLIGGEPCLHPQFKELCDVARGRVAREKLALFTSHPEIQPQDLVEKTFGFVAYHPRDERQKECSRHQPLTLAVEDVAPMDMVEALIEDCWCQRTWCPNVTPKGAFFCEIAGCLDLLMEGPGGWPIEPGWWERSPLDCQEQRKRWCGKCGMPVPCEREPLGTDTEQFSPGLLREMAALGLPRLDSAWTTLRVERFTREEIEAAKEHWFPGNYRGDRTADESAPEGKGATK